MIDLVVDAVTWLFRSVVVDFLLEVVVKGPGYAILRRIGGPGRSGPDGLGALLTGALFWAAVGAAGYLLVRVIVPGNG
jgi:hypothetical protein